MTRSSVLHVVVTPNFAGTERYVADVATETAALGWRVTVVGGDPARMPAELSADVRWLPGAAITQALRSVSQAGTHDICHVHLTYAEAVGAATRPFHHGALVATRHFAARRGASLSGHLLAPWLDRAMDRQIAISHFVDSALERPADTVLHNGTRPSALLWRRESRRVLVLQRLEPEKNTGIAIEAWKLAELWKHGWTLRIVGSGSQELALKNHARGLPGVEFAGFRQDVADEFRQAGMLLATAEGEPFGLSVVEAMSAGIPVVAAASGGHLETIGRVFGAGMYTPGEGVAASAAAELQRLALDPESRSALSGAELQHHAGFTLRAHTTQLLREYCSANRRLTEVPGE